MSEDEPPREADALDGVPAPEATARLVGHDAALAGFRERIAARRLPGGLLLHGPRGIGKATLAFRLATELLAATGDENEGRVAEQVAAGSHPNLFVLRRRPREKGAGFYDAIRVDEVRELRQRMRQTRGRAGWRVAVVDAIDDANRNAANALLKILEEPPAETVFVLVSHRPAGLLPTIRSRCEALALRPLAEAEVIETVSAAAPGVAEGEVARAAAMAAGRPRRALEALTIGEGGLLEALGRWLADPAAAPTAAHLALADGLAAARDGAEAGFAREMILDRLAAEARDAALAGAGGRLRLASATRLWEKAVALFADADTLNLDPRQTLVSVLDALRAHVQQTAEPAAPR